MKFSLSFLANDLSQLPKPQQYGNTAVEATLFNRSHLEPESWARTWDNIKTACELYGNENVTFHFPMNECNYVDSPGILSQLGDSFKKASDLGLRGVVVHSNLVKPSPEWDEADLKQDQERVISALLSIKNQSLSNTTWLGLENMPLVGNDGLDTDPLFCTADDLMTLPGEIGVVWDVCHASASEHFIQLNADGKLPDKLMCRSLESNQLDMSKIAYKIVHCHFAAFTGYNDLKDNVCTEGVLPSEGDIGEAFYATKLQDINSISSDVVINFEVQEQDYVHRARGPQIIRWAQDQLQL